MANGTWQGKDAHHPDVRKLFDRDAVLASDWYHKRLTRYRDLQVALYQRHRDALKAFLASSRHEEEAQRLGLAAALASVEARLVVLATPKFLASLQGTLGADSVFGSHHR